MRMLHVSHGGEIKMQFNRTAPLATKLQWSPLLLQVRRTCPDTKRAGLSLKDRTKVGARFINGRGLINLGEKTAAIN